MKYTPHLEGRLKEVYGEKIIRKKGMTRREQVVLAQLRAGHCNETKYYRKRTGQIEEAICDDCGGEEEKDHIFYCGAFERVRWELGVRNLDVLRDDAALLEYLRRVRATWLF